MEETTDPLDISKEQELVKDAQKELSKLDVLVCGGCHEVFHFVEEFQRHKTDECTNISVLKCENEEKSQIWGFTLWKVKRMKMHRSRGEELPTSWEIYQTWTKLDQVEKDLWITAGRTLQYAHKMANVKVKDIVPERNIEKDPLAVDEEIDNSKINKKALRTSKDNEKEEYNVEKIIGKRFNHRKRIWEYEVKWENYEEPTWEPVLHLQNCKTLVHEFENKLKLEKEMREKDKPPGRGRGRPRINPINPQNPGTPVKVAPKKAVMLPSTAVLVAAPGGGRPQRTSKQKALNQVKAWCGNISDEESGIKRPFDEDGESDDSFEKKLKLEGESDTEEEETVKPPVRKIAKILHTYNNGTGKKLPDNVLIPDAKGVVRISQKQLPSLSSGVYIMSKSSGIIKLDPTASKIATSGGQAIVKVSPKIGQTQIKIIKKDDGSKRVVQVKQGEQGTAVAPTAILTPIAPKPAPTRFVQQVPKLEGLTPVTPKPTPTRLVHQVVTRTPVPAKKEPPKKVETPKPQPKLPEKKEEPKPIIASQDEDSDDGIPELEFPTDLPLPVPDSPPREFTLDPFTGKVVGMDYSEEPQLSKEKASQNLDNIVKLAAADITEEDLTLEQETLITQNSTIVTSPSMTVTTTTNNVATVTTSTTVVAKTNKSILSTAMVNSNILQKTLQSPRPKTQPRIINQSVAKPRTTIAAVVRNPPQRSPVTSVRPKQQALPKPKFNISPVNPVKNVYSAKTNSVAKRIGQTTIYKTKPQQPTPQIVRRSPQKVTKPISMPTLDEDPPTPAVVLAPKAVAEVPTVESGLSTFTLAAGDRPMFITGDDGTVYQVAGQNEEGQTILVTQDSDGQQQCLLVTSEALQEETEPEAPAGVLMEVAEQAEAEAEAEEQPLVAQFIRTEPPSPGGTHKVVVMMPDGDVMVTQVTPEEYASLELDK